MQAFLILLLLLLGSCSGGVNIPLDSFFTMQSGEVSPSDFNEPLVIVTAAAPEVEVSAVVVPVVTPYDTIEQTVSANGMPRLGDPDAPLHAMLFSAFDCPHCANFNLELMPVLTEFAASGDIVVEFVPLDFFSSAEMSTRADYCLIDKGHFWAFMHVQFANQRDGQDLNDMDLIEEVVQSIGGDVDVLQTCLDTDRANEGLAQSEVLMQEYGVTGTPSLIIRGERIQVSSPDELREAIMAALDG